MLVVVGTRLDQAPRFWDKSSEWYLPQVKAMMVSYADFHRSSTKRRKAMDKGIRSYLGVDEDVLVYLDNGSFAFWRQGLERPIHEYTEFVTRAEPDWYPVPADFIPHPQLSHQEQRQLFEQTMQVNLKYAPKGYIPVIHAGDWLELYLEVLEKNRGLHSIGVALGGLVPRLLTSKGSVSRKRAVDAIRRTRITIPTALHVFGIGGLTTLHLAAALGVDAIDSSGWRNRAARGLVLLPGRGERSVVPLGNWRGIEVSTIESQMLESCTCPACQTYGLEGLKANNRRGNKEGQGNGTSGFNRRAIHNLYTLLREADEVDARIASGEYKTWYREHVKGDLVLRLIEYALNHHTHPDSTR